MSTTTDTTTEQVAGSVEYIDPQALEFEDNVRDQVELDKEFLASLRELGVIVPIIAVRDTEGRTLVREGQCRTLGAREVGLSSVPVYVLPTGASDDDTATAERIVQQVVANDRRYDLKKSQRARAIQQLLDTGMSATKVAKKLSMRREDVKAAGAVSKSATALDALDGGQLDFTQAEVLAEFQDDEDAVQRLLRAAHYGGSHFEHAVSSLRSAREINALIAVAEKEYTEPGYTILEDRPRWSDLSAVGLEYLRTSDDEQLPDDVEKKPEHWAVYLTDDCVYVDKTTGDEVAEGDIDWDTENDDDAEPAEGLCHASTITEKTVIVPEWYCLDYAAAGLALAPSLRNVAARQAGSTIDSDDDSPEAIAEREAAQQAAERRERRKVLVLNRLADAAESVRRDYVTKLLARKTAPKGAATFVAHCLTRDPYILSQNHGSGLTAELLGVKDERAVRAMVNDFSTNIDARAQVISLAVVLGALEARTDKSVWRNARTGITGTASYIASTVGSDAYLQFLIDSGYQPSDIEKVIVGQRTADDVYDEATQES
ncbi:ParB N-terminal domain-containing protein (plasmid) [Mycolicibacterium crocinum]|uniref:Chromosome partitioning protein ParB n=2 Tax=Mycolicibacterium TaxID=1866885 RepID=A0A064CDU6_9MYCO|nr:MULTISPECIES: ParB N-terminal domain-containing protein [Mycolicibacterium]KDE96927.1 chromosome partitioning protein ParB [Mycolicibacterium aromaticivorans JS19b1 = JCM 16368]ULN44764.1 ParB N-terminal domain-containing protein [Mycolicibacterium crocinum]